MALLRSLVFRTRSGAFNVLQKYFTTVTKTTLDDKLRLTTEESYSFIKDKLRIADPESKRAEDPGAFLDLVAREFQWKTPWNNVAMVACPPNERLVHTHEKIRHDLMSGIGAVCFPQNTFGLSVLRGVGYEADLISSQICDIFHGHPLIVVYDVSGPGSKHLVDFGAGSPMFRAIPLDFEDTTPEYRESYVTYRFKRDGDTFIRQHRADTDPANRKLYKDFTFDGWINYYEARPHTPVSVEMWQELLVEPYTNVNCIPSYLDKVNILYFPEGRYICINNTKMWKEDEEGRVHRTDFASRDELEAAFARYFPTIPKQMLNAALDDEHVKLDFSKGLKSNILQ